MLALAKGDETNCGGLAQPEIKDWLPAWILIGYDTGLRFGDILGLTRSNIRNGSVCCTANKTGKSLVRKLSSDATAAALVLIKTSNDGSLFSGILTRRRAFVSWNHFLKRHHLRGSSKWLRRSCATYLDLNTPGSATNYLQHSSPALAMRHYIDQSLGAVPEGPPSIK
jgi:integrase